MKIALFGSTGQIGRRIARQAIYRGHEVTAVLRAGGAMLDLWDPKLTRAEGDIFDAASVARIAKGHDIVASAYGPPPGSEKDLLNATHALIEGTRTAGVARLIMVGGAGSLYVAPGVHLVDSPHLPEAYKPIARAHGEALEILRKADLDWTCLSPPAMIAAGEQTGKYRVGGTELLSDANGKSAISSEDYAIAFVDEIEKAAHKRLQFTVAY